MPFAVIELKQPHADDAIGKAIGFKPATWDMSLHRHFAYPSIAFRCEVRTMREAKRKARDMQRSYRRFRLQGKVAEKSGPKGHNQSSVLVESLCKQ